MRRSNFYPVKCYTANFFRRSLAEASHSPVFRPFSSSLLSYLNGTNQNKMPKRINIYYNLGWWFILFIFLSFAAFYTTYFSVILQPKDPILHIHFILMTIWMLILVVQPFLIKYKKLALHRTIGKISYGVVPMVLLSAFLMMRYSYYGYINGLQQSGKQLSQHQVYQLAASYEAIALLYFSWFLIFYILGITYRKKALPHARYMLATALTLLGPIMDRITVFYSGLPETFPYELPSFLIIDAVLLLLLWKDYRDRRPLRTLGTCIAVYGTGQVLYFTARESHAWQVMTTFLMQPAP